MDGATLTHDSHDSQMTMAAAASGLAPKLTARAMASAPPLSIAVAMQSMVRIAALLGLACSTLIACEAVMRQAWVEDGTDAPDLAR